ncbi:PD-(D/E)XK nuclease domain-containing protein [Pseudomonas taetrolens]|uniref:PD-(D/E)XK nuclease domain-containing protein n=1 Tax=Pseudomonas taetrolens TaxID=47884 RepID=UPI003F9A58C2
MHIKLSYVIVQRWLELNTHSPFTKKEQDTISEMDSAVSGSAEEQFIQESFEFYRYWLSSRPSNDLGPDTQALLLIFAEAPEIDWGFTYQPNAAPVKAYRMAGTLSEGVVVCNQNFRTILKLCGALTVDEAYPFIEENLSAANTFVLGKFGQKKMQIHRSGQEIEEWFHKPEEVTIKNDDISLTPEMLADDLTNFHREYLSTSMAIAARNMWEVKTNEKRFSLRTQPERHVQSFLLTYLKGSYRKSGVFINEEINNQGGRTDIVIERETLPGSKQKVNTVIELKILSSAKSLQANCDWAISGINQAKGYANSETDACFACLYDARHDKQDMPELKPHADKQDVRLGEYSMQVPADPVPKKVNPVNTTPTKKAALPKAKKTASGSKGK